MNPSKSPLPFLQWTQGAESVADSAADDQVRRDEGLRPLARLIARTLLERDLTEGEVPGSLVGEDTGR